MVCRDQTIAKQGRMMEEEALVATDAHVCCTQCKPSLERSRVMPVW